MSANVIPTLEPRITLGIASGSFTLINMRHFEVPSTSNVERSPVLSSVKPARNPSNIGKNAINAPMATLGAIP